MNSHISLNTKSSSNKLVAHGRSLDLSTPAIMYIVNLTCDSFSDAGRFTSTQQAVDAVLWAFDNGAHIVDLGAESTRPGALAVHPHTQLSRLLPVIEQVRKHSEGWLSVDTSSALVMRETIALGADIINDVRALCQPDALSTVAATQAGVCLMHMQGEPRNMQDNPRYEDTTREVADFLLARANTCLASGIAKQRIVIDPGFGFGKTCEDNIRLLAELENFAQLGFVLLTGISRKSMLGKITGKDVHQRLAASITAATLACIRGADIIRVHDLEATVDMLKVFNAVTQERKYD